MSFEIQITLEAVASQGGGSYSLLSRILDSTDIKSYIIVNVKELLTSCWQQVLSALRSKK